MKSIQFYFAIAVITLFMVSCLKDKENPTILITEPENHSEHHWGSTVNIKASFRDDRGLSSYHIYIGTEAGEQKPEFDVEFAADITGKSFDFQEYFIVPDSVESLYYLHVEVKDKEGKSTTDKLMLHFME